MLDLWNGRQLARTESSTCREFSMRHSLPNHPEEADEDDQQAGHR